MIGGANQLEFKEKDISKTHLIDVTFTELIIFSLVRLLRSER